MFRFYQPRGGVYHFFKKSKQLDSSIISLEEVVNISNDTSTILSTILSTIIKRNNDAINIGAITHEHLEVTTEVFDSIDKVLEKSSKNVKTVSKSSCCSIL